MWCGNCWTRQQTWTSTQGSSGSRWCSSHLLQLHIQDTAPTGAVKSGSLPWGQVRNKQHPLPAAPPCVIDGPAIMKVIYYLQSFVWYSRDCFSFQIQFFLINTAHTNEPQPWLSQQLGGVGQELLDTSLGQAGHQSVAGEKSCHTSLVSLEFCVSLFFSLLLLLLLLLLLSILFVVLYFTLFQLLSCS